MVCNPPARFLAHRALCEVKDVIVISLTLNRAFDVVLSLVLLVVSDAGGELVVGMNRDMGSTYCS